MQTCPLISMSADADKCFFRADIAKLLRSLYAHLQ